MTYPDLPRHQLQPDDLWGRNLRFSLLTLLWQRGWPCTITELTDELGRLGLTVRGDPPKTVGDALRYEVSIGRVRRVGRGRYAGLERPPTTVRRHRDRLRALVEIAAEQTRPDPRVLDSLLGRAHGAALCTTPPEDRTDSVQVGAEVDPMLSSNGPSATDSAHAGVE